MTGRTVEKAWTAPAGSTEKADGPCVVVELKALPMVDSSADAHPEDGPVKEWEARGQKGPQLGSHGNPQPLPVMEAEVKQTGLVETTGGRYYGPAAAIKTDSVKEPVVEDFIRGTFTDKNQQDAALSYNLYIPKNYNPRQKYPLVLFMHDAGCVSPDIKTTLVQGLGAVAFPSPAWQAEHPCFVLAPQYDTVIVDDNYQYGPEPDRTIDLIRELCRTWSIDTDRIYNTGQSMGAMTALAMDIKYPDFFAGSYLVAGKWNEVEFSPLRKQHIWAVASEGDPGANPSFTRIMDNLEKSGVKVLRQTLDPAEGLETLDAGAASLIQPDCSHYLTFYKGGTHRSTWQYAYSMTPALEWLFAQKK